jgi:hypothetical protein
VEPEQLVAVGGGTAARAHGVDVGLEPGDDARHVVHLEDAERLHREDWWPALMPVVEEEAD